MNLKKCAPGLSAQRKQKPEAMASKGKVAYRRPKTAICESSVSCSYGYARNSKYSKCVQPVELIFFLSRPIEPAFGAQVNQIQKFLTPLLQRPLRMNPRAPNLAHGHEQRLPIPHRNCSIPEPESCPLDALQAPFGCDADGAAWSGSLSSLRLALCGIAVPRTLRIPVRTRSNVSLHFHSYSCIRLAFPIASGSEPPSHETDHSPEEPWLQIPFIGNLPALLRHAYPPLCGMPASSRLLLGSQTGPPLDFSPAILLSSLCWPCIPPHLAAPLDSRPQ
jgi:hypothetical protein